MDISIIIPTLNEEKNISRSIKQFKSIKAKHEIIVADGNSTDKTKEIAKKLGARVVINKNEHTIGEARNIGAELAKGELLVFIDADTKLKDVDYAIERIKEIFTNKEIVAALPKMEVFPEERKHIDTVFSWLFNHFLGLSFRTKTPFAFGQCQAVRRTAFKKVGGYPRERVHAEDSYLYQKLTKLGRLYHMTDVVVYESPRRYRKTGYVKLFLLSSLSIAYYQLFKRNLFKEWERVD